jgi:hypothetical protein
MKLRYRKFHRRVATNPPYIPTSSNFKAGNQNDDVFFLLLIHIAFQQKARSKATDGDYEYVTYTQEIRSNGF